MRCPKCNFDIDDKMLICPNCKKVLKLVCPKCNTLNKTNACRKCGFTIISKCHQCGKINQTIKENCTKCGFSTYTSVGINTSNIDEFACITIEFPNLADIQSALGSTKLTDKFKSNLDRLILNYTKSIGLKREIIENIYVIRFNKDISFSVSCQSAMKAAIDIQNLVTELNFKLINLGVRLQCNIAVLKRDIYSKPDQYKSGFDIKLIYQHKKDFNLLNSLQIITDSYVYERVLDKYDLSALTAKFIKNEIMTFFELNLKKYVKIPKPPKEEEVVNDLSKLNIFGDGEFDEAEMEGDLYDIDAINFNELKCSFIKTKTANAISEVIVQLKHSSKKIVSVKCKKEFFPKTKDILDELNHLNAYKNIFRVTCHDEMKYKPYGFFYELISCIYNFSQSTKNFAQNDFEMFKDIDSSGFLADLINLNERKFPHPEDVRYSLFDIFLNIFASMSNSLIYIENFEKIDDTSHEVLQLIFEKFNELDVSYVIVEDKEFSLHKNSHFLLANPNYVEITLKPTPFKEIVVSDMKRYSKILDSYYMKKIAQNTKGSLLYFSNAIDYLLEKELLYLEKGVLESTDFENVMIPTTLDELIAKRFIFLARDKEAHKMFAMLLLIGPVIDLSTLRILGQSDDLQSIEKLADKKYIYVFNNTIYIQNYNLYRDNFLAQIPPNIKQSFAKELLERAYASERKHPVETVLYKILGLEKKEFIVWEELSRINASMGDFSAYLNCSVKFLRLLDNHIDENSQKTIEEYKMEIYENISNLLYRYTPNEINNITQIILNNLEKTTNDKKIIALCNKMLQGCLIGGNYSQALDLAHKILSRFSNSSLNPADPNFNINFFLISLVKIEVLFSIGNLKDCVDSGDEILEILSPQNIASLKPQSFSQKQFEDVIFDAMSFVSISRVILLRSESELIEFIDKIYTNIGRVPQVFDLFLGLTKVIKGEKIEYPSDIDVEDDKFSKVIVNFIKAFTECKGNYNKFADTIYQAKIEAKMHKLSQVELICDLLIGFSYFKLEQNKKAASIYYNVLDTSTKNGLKTVTYLDWYLMSMLKFSQQDIEVAFGIASNAIIQLEKDNNSGDFLLFLLRILLSKILIAKGDKKSAELCLNNAKYIQEKYGLNFKIGEAV